tara:strand:- start:278 stop:391 length:114 start_codon:yes stop_codon:yes gene_type:complete
MMVGDPYWIMPTTLQEACQFEKIAENREFLTQLLNMA